MQTLVLNFLGTPAFERNGIVVRFVRAKGIALLLYLAVMRDTQPRERVLDLLWPESLPQAARKNMRNTLWALGEAFGHDLLEHANGNLRLAPHVLVDVHQLEDGLLLLESGSVQAIEQAAQHYRGVLADGLLIHEAPDFEIWLQTERERLTAVYLKLLERTIRLHCTAGDWPRVVSQAQRILIADPLGEPIHVILIEAYIRLGQRSNAIQQYATLCETLQRELAVAPLPETTARYEALLANRFLPAATLPIRSASHVGTTIPFIGRAAELALLEAERVRVAHGEARIVLISGDLGMGKTRLWQTWLETHTTDTILLTTHALETAEPVPFGPILTLFRQAGPAHSLLQPPSALAPIWLAELARLLPEIATLWPNLPAPLALPPAEERGRLLQALSEALRLLATPLLVLVVDDLHWADPSTLDWLIYLVDQLKDMPLLLVGTYRPHDAGKRLVTTAAGWQRQGCLRQITLDHLTPHEAQQLLVAIGTPADQQQMAGWVQQSGGNPYFLIELQRTPSDHSANDLAALVHTRIQATVPAQAMQVLQAAAVLSDNTTFTLLQATSGRSEEETLDALDALQAAAVLVSDERMYRFVHPLVASVVYADLGAARRSFLHRRAAEALERSNAQHTEQVAGQLMEHYAAASEYVHAAHYAEQAAAQALTVGAFVETAAYAQHALDWQPTAKRQFLLGQALVFIGSASAAQAQLEAAIKGFDHVGDPIGAARACITLMLIAVGSSQPDLIRKWLAHPSIQRMEELDPALYTQALLAAASMERQTEAYDKAASILDRAGQLAREQHRTDLDLQITFERGNLLADQGDLQASLGAFAEAQQLAEASTNPVYSAMAWNNLAYHTLLSGDTAQAQQYIDIAIELTKRYTLHFVWQYVYSTAGEIALAQGELNSADTAFTRAYESARAWGNHVHMANVRANQALVAKEREDLSLAHRLIDEAQVLFGKHLDAFVRNKIARVSASLK